jgi:Met-zincin/Domain of unknown function (DUF5117)
MTIRHVCSCCLLSLGLVSMTKGSIAQTGPDAPSAGPIPKMASTMQKEAVLLPIRWDAKKGKLFLGVPLTGKNGTTSTEYVLADSLTYGVGQNDLQMDRGQVGINADEILGPGPRLVYFERSGPKLLLIQENTKFRTSSSDPAQQLAVRQSFPSSVLAAFEIADETDGFVVVDATDYGLEDIQAIGETLNAKKQGSYKISAQRSVIVPEGTKSFAKNTDIEAELTFISDSPNDAKILADVVPEIRALTVRERHIFLPLPEPGFAPRRYSPRSGYFDMTYREMNTPLGVDIDQQFIFRHRLQKKDPACLKDCEAVTPIQYYVDRGAPEPLLTALVEGCRWWDEAFQAAGWAKGTFRVDVLPPDADPMDAQYNIIQWVHRFNRGWSFGLTITDPRTGEILKGNVTLGSLRGRQDYLLAEALLTPYKDGRVPDPANDKALAMVLARIRQLAAHETGHTLGLRHNFAASGMPHSHDETMSVMDYPYPWITLDNSGLPDLSHAYPAGIGVWDKVAIDYGYREFDRNGKAVEDPAALDAILHSAELKGALYLSDDDASLKGSASPIAHLWDNGTDAVDELTRILEVRRVALERFGEDALRPGVPQAHLEDTLVPLYLLHRYQTTAAAKIIGGLDYRYVVRGDGQRGPQFISPVQQRAAIAAVAKTLSPAALTLPESLLRQLPPRTPGMRRTLDSLGTIENFVSHTSVTFDPVAAAESAADLTLGVLFQPERANRLLEHHARDSSQPNLEEVIDAALSSAGTVQGGNGLANLVSVTVKARILEALFRLGADPKTTFAARTAVLAKLRTVAQSLPSDSTGEEFKRRIAKFESDPESIKPLPVVEAPPGSPIGDDEVF